MVGRTQVEPTTSFALESHGVSVSISGAARVVAPAVRQMGASVRRRTASTEPMPSDEMVGPGAVTAGATLEDNRWVVSVSGEEPVTLAHEADAADELAQRLHSRIARQSPDRLFVHAGVVAWGSQLVVFPGVSGAGKSTLVRAAIEAGATYYSDEFAVLDSHGRVHPYPRWLSIRSRHGRVAVDPEALGAEIGVTPQRPAAVVVTQYAAGATWAPEPIDGARGALPIVANTVLARRRGRETMRRAARLARSVPVVSARRGAAAPTVEAIRRWLASVALPAA